MIIHTLDQKTPEWFAVRKGKMTASNAQAIAACGKGLETYITELMSEYYSSGEKEHFSNVHIDRGVELEPTARDMYILETGNEVQEVWFCEYNEYVGCSPDWLVGDDWLVEIKCMNDAKHFKLIINGESEIDTWYIWQMQMQMLITGRKWCDFIGYNPNFQKSLVIIRIPADADKHKKLLEWFEIGKVMIQNLQLKYNNRLWQI